MVSKYLLSYVFPSSKFWTEQNLQNWTETAAVCFFKSLHILWMWMWRNRSWSFCSVWPWLEPQGEKDQRFQCEYSFAVDFLIRPRSICRNHHLLHCRYLFRLWSNDTLCCSKPANCQRDLITNVWLMFWFHFLLGFSDHLCRPYCRLRKKRTTELLCLQTYAKKEEAKVPLFPWI